MNSVDPTTYNIEASQFNKDMAEAVKHMSESIVELYKTLDPKYIRKFDCPIKLTLNLTNKQAPDKIQTNNYGRYAY